jgi:integrase
VCAILTTAMKHASTRKGARQLRVREAEGNPCEGVPPPRRGGTKRRHWCRSAWLNAALASPKNDRAIKEAVAIGIGLHLRPGELHELRVRDLDLDAGEVRVHRSFGEGEKKVKKTKTDEGVRTVTIPAWLLPLLKRSAEERAAGDHLAPWIAATPEDERAEAFRTFLRNGGAAPEHIFKDSETHEKIDFRSVRDTGVTLRFLAGERAEVVQREAGHKHPATTLGYAKEVANKGGRYGSASLTLPPELGGPTPGGGASALCALAAEDVNGVNRNPVFPDRLVARVGFEPTTFGL